MKTKITIPNQLYTAALFTIAFCFSAFAQQDYYWVGGTGNWSDYENHWATSSGGSTFHTSIPSSVDNVFFDENSFVEEGQIVSLDIAGFSDNRIHDMDWRGSLHNPSLVTQAGTDNYLRVHGSIYFHEGMTVDVTKLSIQITTAGESAEFDPGGVDLTNTLISYFVNKSDASLALMDSLSAKSFGTGNFITGQFTSNGHPIHTSETFIIDDDIEGTGILDFSGTHIYTQSITLTSTVDGLLDINNLSVSIVYSGGRTIIDSSLGVIPFYEIQFDHQIMNEAPSFGNMVLKPGVELLIDETISEVEFENIEATGTPVANISIRSSTSGTAATLIQSAGEVYLRHVALQDIIGTGGATFIAYSSIDNGNVTGVNFLADLDQIIIMELETKDYEDIGGIYVPTLSATSGLEVTLESSDPSVAEVINGNELLINGLGTTLITAAQDGGGTYNAADQVSESFSVTKANQVITLEEIPDIWIGEGSVTLQAASSAGLPISYHLLGPGELNGNTIEFNEVGTVQVTASQAGNENYLAAEDVEITFNVFKRADEITFSAIPDTWIGEGSVNLDATSSGGLSVSYHILGPAELDGNNVVFSGAGNVQVTASTAGNDNYLPASDIIVEFEVFKKAQTITFAEISDTSEDEGFVNLDAASDSNLPITFSVVGPAEEVNGVIEFAGNGMVQVTAKQEGNDLYLAAENVHRSFEILASETEEPLFLTQPEGLGLVYPNPVADYLYFDPQLKIETIRASDLSGRVFFDGALIEGHIDVSAWDTGNYIFQIRTVSGEEITTRIIRN